MIGKHVQSCRKINLILRLNSSLSHSLLFKVYSQSDKLFSDKRSRFWSDPQGAGAPGQLRASGFVSGTNQDFGGCGGWDLRSPQ